MVTHSVSIIGAGPAGLMAAETLLQAGVQVSLYDAMPSVGRKFLLAGKGGLNLTHSEAAPLFLSRYGESAAQVAPWLERLDATALRQWADALGAETFVGSSGRVFPKEMKAAPLLRAWLHRLRSQGLQLHTRHRCTGWNDDGQLCFDTPKGEVTLHAPAVILALGGGSWSRLGSDAAWMQWLGARGVQMTDLEPSNGGVVVPWSKHFAERFAGQAVKTVAMQVAGQSSWRRGEIMITETGIEGGLVYALSANLRALLRNQGHADFALDLTPDRDLSAVEKAVSAARSGRSWSTFLQRQLGLKGVKLGLLYEVLPRDEFENPQRLARTIKSLPLRAIGLQSMDEAISTAGGVATTNLDDNLMLCHLPGVFCAGEMLDWDAPTGGYLLTASFASGKVAAEGVMRWLVSQSA
ncbi:TIGR03862 family flavoprotein [Paenalcaligenes sp. Me131]|uniref:TIGR03862 family flavoprotein n=1 Tax=Paenalcaligenes sp. Me131 TaxID=3392636 RepID=UPI003D2AD904